VRRPRDIAVLLIVLLAVAAPTAAAHELQVLDAGSAEVDAGMADPARLIHAVLVQADDELVVSVTPGEQPLEAELLLPDRKPESHADAAAWPRIELRWRGGGSLVAIPRDVIRELVVDAATGIPYVQQATVPIPSGRGPVDVVVRRGDAPSRVALRVGAPAPFAASDPERTPRMTIRSRLWAETPPPGTRASEPRRVDGATVDRRFAVGGAVIALAGVLIAAWWMRRGGATARRRGLGRTSEDPGPDA
jgi:hypothetical protein